MAGRCPNPERLDPNPLLAAAGLIERAALAPNLVTITQAAGELAKALRVIDAALGVFIQGHPELKPQEEKCQP